METTLKSEIIRFFVIETRDFDELLHKKNKKNKFRSRRKKKGRNQFKKQEITSGINITSINSYKDVIWVILIYIVDFLDKVS